MTDPPADPLSKPLVSIVVPCFNAEQTLRSTLESALDQTYGNLEIIVVDDGSQDGTCRILESFGDRIRWHTGPNQGAGHARNLGTSMARGAFLLYLDADDLLEPEAVRSRLEALERTGADVAYGDWRELVEGPGGLLEAGIAFTKTLDSVHARPELALLTTFWAPPAALLYRRSILARAGGWKQQYAPIEDARMLLDAALCGGVFVHVPGIRAHYRVGRESSHSNRSKPAFLAAILRNALDVEATWLSSQALDPEQEAALASVHDYCARCHFAADPQAFRTSIEALRRLRHDARLSWPMVAHQLDCWFGHQIALQLLRMLRRPAK